MNASSEEIPVALSLTANLTTGAEINDALGKKTLKKFGEVKILLVVVTIQQITRAALDQHSTSANESVEEAWRISSAPRVKCTEWLFFTNNGALCRVMADNGGNGEPGMSYLYNVNQ